MGSVELWPPSLRLAIRMCLQARFPMSVWAGPELLLIYNEAYSQLLGPAKHPWGVGRPGHEVWAEVWEDQLGPELDKVIGRAEPTQHEDQRFSLLRDGKLVESSFSCLFTPIQEGDGRVVGATTVLLETTGHNASTRHNTEPSHGLGEAFPDVIFAKATREAVARQEQQMRLLEAISATTPDFTYIFNPKGQFVYANRRLLEVWGMQLPEVIGKTCRELGYEQWHHDMHMREIAEVIESRRPIKGEVPFKAPLTGVFGVYEYIFTPVLGEHGEVDLIAGTTRDITERKRTEAELRTANEKLAEADRRKNDFIAVLSHELRNPLGPIRNSLYVLERAEPGGEQAKRARKIIDRQVQHMARLVEDLLDVTRIARGKITLQREEVDLNALVRGTAEDYRETFTRKGLELRIEPSDGPLWVDGDRTRLAEAIGDLLDNSAKFTPPGGEAILSVRSDDAGYAVVQVRDNGAGVSAATLQHLFEPFVQGEQSIDRSAGGLGLGLALVKGLVEMHGGLVEARSEGEGKGAELTLKLPLQSTDQPKLTVVRAPEQSTGVRRVLVIEDNKDTARSLKEVLELSRHEVLIAGSGAEGVELARQARPEVVICDIGLPDMDGYGVAQALRADPDAEVRAVFLVALSGYALPEDLARSKWAGFNHHMVKPPSIDAIQTILAEAPARVAG